MRDFRQLELIEQPEGTEAEAEAYVQKARVKKHTTGIKRGQERFGSVLVPGGEALSRTV